MPSPSVSLWIVTFTVSVTTSSPFVAVTVTVTSSVSWLSSVQFTFGNLPVISFPFTVNPSLSTVITASSLFTFAVIAEISDPSSPSTTVCVSGVASNVNGVATLIFASTVCFVPSVYVTTTGIETTFPASASTGV